MPRTLLSRQNDTKNDLIAEIEFRRRTRHITYAELGKVCGLSADGMSKAISRMTLTYKQLVPLFKKLEFTPDKIVWYMSGGLLGGEKWN